MQFCVRLKHIDIFDEPTGINIKNEIYNYKFENIKKNALEFLNNINNEKVEAGIFPSGKVKLAIFPIKNEDYSELKDYENCGNIVIGNQVSINDCFYIIDNINNINQIMNIELLCNCFEEVYLFRLWKQNPLNFNCGVLCKKYINSDTKKIFMEFKNDYFNINFNIIYYFISCMYEWIKYIIGLSIDLIDNIDINHNNINIINLPIKNEYMLYAKNLL